LFWDIKILNKGSAKGKIASQPCSSSEKLISTSAMDPVEILVNDFVIEFLRHYSFHSLSS